MSFISFFGKLLGGGKKGVVGTVVGAIDSFIETPDEKRQFKELLIKVQQDSQRWQAEVNKIEAGHRTMFVAGWRPAIGWTCALTLFYNWIVVPILKNFITELPSVPIDEPMALVLPLLGIAGLRTYEKYKGLSE